jgi:hypothetical protein
MGVFVGSVLEPIPPIEDRYGRVISHRVIPNLMAVQIGQNDVVAVDFHRVLQAVPPLHVMGCPRKEPDAASFPLHNVQDVEQEQKQSFS